VMALNFMVDTGATYVTIPADVVESLMKTGTITKADFLGEGIAVLADGSRMPSPVFQIRSLKIGDVVINNVMANVTPEKKGGLLLGQSFFSRLKSWSLDNTRHVLVIE
jgi:clan AA aspartic protease (TIGR02281 family)